MSIDIARAWKDAAYRASLSAEEQALIPANPAGAVELSDSELELVYGVGKKKDEAKINNDVFVATQGLILCNVTVGVPINVGLGILGQGAKQTSVCVVGN